MTLLAKFIETLKSAAPATVLTAIAFAFMLIALLVVIPLAVGLAFDAPAGLFTLAVMLLWQAKVFADITREP